MAPYEGGQESRIGDVDRQVPEAPVGHRLPPNDGPAERHGCVFEHIPEAGALSRPAGTQRGRRTPFDVKGFEDGVTSRKDGRPSPRSGGDSRKGAGVGPGRSGFPILTPSGPIRPASGLKA